MGFARSDNSAVASGIERMRELVVARGGYVHPAAAIEVRDGSLRVVCNAPLTSGELLFRVPDELLVPTGELCWSDSEEIMQLSRTPGHLDRDRAEMLGLFITIYNASGKMDWVRNQPARVLGRDADLAAQLDLVRPRLAARQLSAAAAFLETRNYSGKSAQAGLAEKACLLPLIDFMNHHTEGSPFQQGDGHLRVDRNSPNGSRECFVNYGKHRDPLGLALSYGFLDRESPFAQSVPIAIDLPGFGRLEVVGIRIGGNHLASPPKVQFSDGGLTLSHLSGDVRSPHVLRALLRLAMMASGKRRGIGDAVTERALADLPAAILAANRAKLDAFRTYLAARPELALASLLSDASLCQLANLETIFAV